MKPLRRAFYDRSPEVVARGLIGKVLLHETDLGVCGGRIVESEAYLACGDSACHASRGQTPRNIAMFGPPGHAYVYSIHAKWCFNVVTERAGIASAVLIRALEPMFGQEWMQARRPLSTARDLARGPARLCGALDITKTQNARDLTTGSGLWIARDKEVEVAEDQVSTSARIGVTSAFDLPLRFYLRGSPFVSGPKRLNG